jgi:hypothetical protein
MAQRDVTNVGRRARRGVTVVLSHRETELLRKKLTPDAEWSLGDAGTADGILDKLRRSTGGHGG